MIYRFIYRKGVGPIEEKMFDNVYHLFWFVGDWASTFTFVKLCVYKRVN